VPYRFVNELNSRGALCDLIIGDSQWIGGSAENGHYVKLNEFFERVFRGRRNGTGRTRRDARLRRVPGPVVSIVCGPYQHLRTPVPVCGVPAHIGEGEGPAPLVNNPHRRPS